MTEELRKNIIVMCDLKENSNTKLKRYLTNRIIIISIILFLFLIIFYCIINYFYKSLNSISTLIITPLLTILLVTISDSYGSEKKKSELLYAFYNEVVDNLIIALKNNNRIILEKKNFDSGGSVFKQLLNLKLNIYNLLKQIFPEEIENLGYFEIGEYIYYANEINQSIRIREDILVHYMTQNFKGIVKNSDENIQNDIGNIIDYIGILLGSNVKICEFDKDNLKLVEIKDLKTYLDSRVNISIINTLNKDRYDLVKLLEKKE